MYRGRSLNTVEEAYINRAQQKIAQIASQLSSEIHSNDVSYELSQISVELQYSIDTLVYDCLDWSDKQINTMIDYYTLRAELTEFSTCTITHTNIYILAGSACATVEMLESLKVYLIGLINAGDSALYAALNLVESNSITRDQAIWDYINSNVGGGSSVLPNALSSVHELGGITVGKYFPAGTPTVDMWKIMLEAKPEISNIVVNGIATPFSTPGTWVVTSITWDSVGLEGQLTLTDNKGILNNVIVTGNSYTPSGSLNYNIALGEEITWTLTNQNASATIGTVGKYRSYYGKNISNNDTPVVVTTAMLQAAKDAGDSILSDTSQEITASLNTANTYHGWIAVEKSQAGSDYTKWFVDEDNKGSIAVDEFIILPTELTFESVVYKIYRWGYRSPLFKPLKLYK